jgi:hypothetical protein
MKTKKNLKRLLLKLLMSNEQQIVELIQKYAKLNKDIWNVEVHKRFVVVTPKQLGHYPLVCSHYDTVRNSPLSGYNIKEDIVTSIEGALGGDDRCGVAIALSLMQAGILANYAFFDEEECGAGGSNDFLIETPWIAKESSCYLGLDRRGHKDAAVYNYRSEKLLDIVGIYGYKEVSGSMTDVSVIEEAFPKATVNLSVGFNREHSSNESIRIDVVINTLQAMEKIVDTCTDVYFDDLEAFSSYKDYGYYPDYHYRYDEDLLLAQKDLERLMNGEYGYDAQEEIRMHCDDCLYFDFEACDCHCENKWECFSAQDVDELRILSTWNAIGGAK